MKICFLTSQLKDSDGWGAYSVGLIYALKKQGVDCVVLTPIGSPGEVAGVKNYKILPPLFCPRYKKTFYLLKFYFQIKKIINETELVHCLVEPLAIICQLTKKPYFITLHGTHIFSSLKNQRLRKKYLNIYQGARKIFCVSHYTQKKVLSQIPLTNTMVINNGVDVTKFNNLEGQKESDQKIILSVGGIKFRKGYHISIPALAKVKKRFNNLKYYIVGSSVDSGYLDQLKRLVKKMNLEKDIKFCIDIPEKELLALYSRASLFMLTPVNQGSHFEGFGLVYLEANAAGLPVIGTYDCGAEDAIKNGFNGILVPQNDVKKTAQAILKILEDKKLSETLSKNGKIWAQKFNWDKIAQNYKNQYITKPL